MSSNERYVKGFNENKSKTFRIKIIWCEDSFQLFIIENRSSWFASVTKENIQELAELHELDPNVYFEQLQGYFTNEDECSIFDIVKLQFIMYRKIPTEKLRIKYFFTKLKEENYQKTVEKNIDELVTKHENMLKQLAIAEKEKVESESEKILYQKKCEEFIEIKQKSDNKMYSAFTLLLNEKKQRIQFLTETLDEYKSKGVPKLNLKSSTELPLSQNKKSQKNKIENVNNNNKSISFPSTSKMNEKIPQTNSESGHRSDSEGYDTDEEKRSKAQVESKKSTVTSKDDDLDFLGDSSPPHSLPKRVKPSHSTQGINSLLDSPKKGTQKNSKVDETKVDPMEVQEEDIDEKSLAFNTQELWDRM